MRSLLSVGGEATGFNQDAHFRYNLLSISLAQPLKAEFFAREYLRETAVSPVGTGKRYQ